MSDMLQIPTCRSPVSPHPGLIATLEINGGLVHERSDPAVLITLVFLPFYANRPWENALWPDYLILTATHAPVLFMDMPNLTFTMVIQGEHLRWRHGRDSEGSCLLLCLRPGSEQKTEIKWSAFQHLMPNCDYLLELHNPKMAASSLKTCLVSAATSPLLFHPLLQSK